MKLVLERIDSCISILLEPVFVCTVCFLSIVCDVVVGYVCSGVVCISGSPFQCRCPWENRTVRRYRDLQKLCSTDNRERPNVQGLLTVVGSHPCG